MQQRTKVSLKVLPRKGEKLLFILSEDNENPVESNITLRNKSSTLPLAFKVKTNCADRYWVEPKAGLLLPDSVQNIRVELRPEFVRILLGNARESETLSADEQAKKRTALSLEMESKDKFLIQSVSLLQTEVQEMVSISDFETIVFERASTPETLNTKRTVQLEVNSSMPAASMNNDGVKASDGDVLCETPPAADSQDCDSTSTNDNTRKDNENNKNQQDQGNKRNDSDSHADPTTKDATMTHIPATKSISPDDLLNAAKSKINMTEKTVTNDFNLQKEKTEIRTESRTEQELRSILKGKDTKIISLQTKLTQTEQQLRQSVEQHRTARKSLDVLRKAAQDTVAREKLMSRSKNVAVGPSKGPSSDLVGRSPAYWSSLNEADHPNFVRTYPLSYLPGPMSYFVLCWCAIILWSFFL